MIEAINPKGEVSRWEKVVTRRKGTKTGREVGGGTKKQKISSKLVIEGTLLSGGERTLAWAESHGDYTREGEEENATSRGR